MVGGLLAHVDAAQPWEWHAHPDVWLIMATIVFAYRWALKRLGPRLVPAGDPVVTKKQLRWFAAGMFTLWLFSDWPIHEWSEDYLFSIHMLQHNMFSLVAPGLLLLGTPTWLLRHLLVRPGVLPVMRKLCRPLPASLLFNIVVIFTHWPVWVDLTLRSEPVHFFAHVVLVSAALVMWLVVVNPLPELPQYSAPARMLHLFLQSIVPTVPASFLAFAETPLYRFYQEAPRLWGLSVIEDQQLAGAIMKVGGTSLIWGVIIAMFFKWYADSQRDQGDILTWDDVERELSRTRPATPSR